MDVHKLRHQEVTVISIVQFKEQVLLKNQQHMRKQILVLIDPVEQVIIELNNIVFKKLKLLNQICIHLHLVQVLKLMIMLQDHKAALDQVAKTMELALIMQSEHKERDKLNKSDKIMQQAERKLLTIFQQKVIQETIQNKIQKII